jgi:hypothetical protein
MRRPQVLNKHIHGIPKNAVFIGRPTKWGNPFALGLDMDRETSVKLYELRLLNTPELMSSLHELRGKDLVCFCAPKACHGDVLLRYANLVECPKCLSKIISCRLPIEHKGALFTYPVFQTIDGQWYNSYQKVLTGVEEVMNETFFCSGCGNSFTYDESLYFE